MQQHHQYIQDFNLFFNFNKLVYLFQRVSKLQLVIKQQPTTNNFSSYAEVLIGILRRWELTKISQRQLMQSEDFSALWEARRRNLQVDHYINCFTINIKSRWKLCLTLRLYVCFGVTLQIFMHWFPCRNNFLAMLEADISLSNNFGLCSEWFEATGGSF